MNRRRIGPRRLASAVLAAALCVAPSAAFAQMAASPMRAPAGATPQVGQTAADFALTALDGSTVRLAEQTARGPVVLVVLRGWPGYQCPFCTRQFGDYLSHAKELEATGAQVLLVYPGPADGLNDHAKALAADRPLPANYRILIDPDYTFTNAYGLRWNEPNETAYPSTFVLDGHRIVTFAQTSHEHGGRVPVTDVLAALTAQKTR